MKLIYSIIAIIILFDSCTNAKNSMSESNVNKQQFVTAKGTQFIKNGQPYYYVGTNFWGAMNLGSEGKSGNKQRLIRELDKLQTLGINNIRIMALTESPNTAPYRIVPANNNKGIVEEDILQGLDFLLTEMQKRNMVAVVCLSNFWPWSGGFAQYQQWVGDIDHIDYPMDTTKAENWDLYSKITAKFYSSIKAMELYNKAIEKIINRKNSFTQKLYKNDATIMSWELCNEPRGLNNVASYLKWIDNTSTYIKTLDKNHLITVGSEGYTPYKDYAGTPFLETHSFKNIDYTTAHVWIQNWGWYNPQKHNDTYITAQKNAIDYIKEHIQIAHQLNKPFVLEEFGIMKDNGSYNPNATTQNRDDFYEFIFKTILNYAKENKAAGINFWAWSGEGKPRKNGGWWKVGDDFTGDPPHELQGWYSVYNTDTATHKVIKKYAALISNVKLFKKK